MKRLSLTFVVFLLVQFSFGQLNPINDLEFDYWYDPGSTCPMYNCFNLQWQTPDNTTQDTLIGYNVYRNSILWRFQDWIGVSCIGEVPCSDVDFIEIMSSFWIKVTAVYNSSYVESIANDSVYFSGVATYLEAFENTNIAISPNPTKDWFYIKQSNTNFIYNIELRNIYGQLAKEESNIKSQDYAMNVADLKAGVYFYVIRDGDKVLQQGKVIVK